MNVFAPTQPPRSTPGWSGRPHFATESSYTADPAELQRRAEAVIGDIQGGWLRIDQGKGYPLERAADAHRDIEGRGTQGKLYLEPNVSARRV